MAGAIADCLQRALTLEGTLVFVGGEGGGRWFGGVDRQLRAFLLSMFVRQRLRSFVSGERKEDLQLLKELIEAGLVKPIIDKAYSLDEVPQAIRYLEEGRVRGKVVIAALLCLADLHLIYGPEAWIIGHDERQPEDGLVPGNACIRKRGNECGPVVVAGAGRASPPRCADRPQQPASVSSRRLAA